MASEYLKWLARDVKPEEKRELTPKEKWKNWWYYHKWHVVIGLIALLCVAGLIRDIVSNRNNQPDFQVAYISATSLPDDTAAALESALAELGEDLNGDGQVLVQVNQYTFSLDSMDYSSVIAGSTLLMADMSNSDSIFFLMEDPEVFQEQYQILSYSDGVYPEEGEEITAPLWYAWSDCPTLTGLDLGSYTLDYTMEEITGDSQVLLSGLYIGRRGFPDEADAEYVKGCNTFWEKMIEGTK